MSLDPRFQHLPFPLLLHFFCIIIAAAAAECKTPSFCRFALRFAVKPAILKL
ncbi:hypothetical protein SUBVAR_06119 [Subdoligranulum variabile DSM 15176]|uniref:Uncharacterized protein n=1 Tax=Subdoligranulum variabile DSM 15176 TaxID=411471 RepID=D1PP06_9FIRM|nr:hypothetical protein SUBVAR_06119 [Subdoligranulum variabile DSM 15176]